MQNEEEGWKQEMEDKEWKLEEQCEIPSYIILNKLNFFFTTGDVFYTH